jgi:hypothetical protein
LDVDVTAQAPSPAVAADSRSAGRTADVVVTVLALLTMLGGVVILVLFSLMSVMATDSCGTGGAELAVCDGNYFATIFFGYWAVLVGVPVLTTIGSLVAIGRHRLAWPYAVGGLVVLGVATVVYFLLMTR